MIRSVPSVSQLHAMGDVVSELPRQRVLQVAYGCDPVSSMESRLGWYRAIASAAAFDTWVICDEENRAHVERYLRTHGPVPGLTIHYLPSTPAQQQLYSKPGRFYGEYHRWHKRALELAESLHREVQFDLTHQVGFCGYREPGYLWKLDIPFVWGPIGGTQNLPWRYLTMLDPPGAAYELLRTVANTCHLRFRRRVRTAAHAASKVFAANSTAQRDMRLVHGVDAELQLETGLTDLPDYEPRRPDPQTPLRILWAGRFRPWKGLPLLLHALRGLDQHIDYEVRLIGHQCKEAAHRRLAKKLGIDQHIHWLGWPAYQDTFEHHAWADVFAFTSLRDTSGTGLLEALAHGSPIVGMDHQGAHDIMTDDCAIPIPVTSPKESIRGFRAAFIDLANNSDRLRQLSRGARARAADFLWSELGRRMIESYREILSQPNRDALRGRPDAAQAARAGRSELSYR